MKAKFKIGDRVRVTEDTIGAKKGTEFTVNYIQYNELCFSYSYSDYQAEKPIIPRTYVIPEDKLELTSHSGKILIMVDEKDNNKIIARDLVTGKKAEAKCNPKDEWDFNKGAKLAFERLTEPEKPKDWTGKVVCVSSCLNAIFTPGNVYTVTDGVITDNRAREWSTVHESFNELKKYFNEPPFIFDFIEYKGGAEE